MKLRINLIYCLLLLLSVAPWFNSACYASVLEDIDCIQEAIEMAIERIDSEIKLEPIQNIDFAVEASAQLEIALICFESAELLEEDYFNLGLYCIAHHYKYFDLASEVLSKELNQQPPSSVRQWLEEQLLQIEQMKNGDSFKFSYKASLGNLKKLISQH